MSLLKIRAIRLENVRSHVNTCINFSNGISVLTGRTGSGKSSVLMAIEYALFGADAGIQNNGILRRGCQHCKIELEFEEDGNTYTIIRALKRQGNSIVNDLNHTKILKNGAPLPLIGRATDLNEKIIEILGYPKDIKPKELFELTSYTRQDEMRAIIELGSEKRQEYIDKILQLAKYRQTWENMKDLLDIFELELNEKKVRLENYDKLQSELLEIESKIAVLENKIKENEKMLLEKQNNYEKLHKVVTELEKERKELLEKRRIYDQLKGSEAHLRKEIEKVSKDIEELLKKKSEINLELSKIGQVPELEELQLKDIDLLKTEEMLNKELTKAKEEFENIKKLGKGKCPLCKQEISEKHIHQVENEFLEVQSNLTSQINSIKEKQNEIRPLITKSKQCKSLKEQLQLIEANLSEKIKYKDNLENNLKETLQKIKIPNIEKLPQIENSLEQSKNEEAKLVSEIQSISRENSILSSELEDRKNTFSQKSSELIELEKSKADIQNLEYVFQTLSRMREDIRNIREIIRNNFLEDFRQEFQKKFEEIRKYEEEYSVDIKNTYEPVAYTSNGEEVPISHLSGGEKTSVALAYRLALADLAAQVSAIKPSEILILDEPTVGFDQEDVKMLPTALRNIRTIPQIIIVTHEEELKNAADYKFNVTKSEGKSIVSAA